MGDAKRATVAAQRWRELTGQPEERQTLPVAVVAATTAQRGDDRKGEEEQMQPQQQPQQQLSAPLLPPSSGQKQRPREHPPQDTALGSTFGEVLAAQCSEGVKPWSPREEDSAAAALSGLSFRRISSAAVLP